MQSFLIVGAGGALGAMGRYGFGQLLFRLSAGGFPFATLGVNIIGSLLMGLLIGLLARFTPDWQAEARLFAAVGVLGGFTTFSAFSLDVVVLFERGAVTSAVLYVLASVCLSILALFAGLMIVRSFGV